MHMNTAVATFVTMGTINTITLFGRYDELTLSHIFRYVQDMEGKLTVHRFDSQVAAINRYAGVAPVKVSDEVFALIRRARAASLPADSGFNLAIGPLSALWRQHQRRQTVPNSQEISTALLLADPQAVELNEAERSVFLKRKSMAIDLGAIAKGYIADGIKRLLQEAGVRRATIDLGGNIVLLGESPTRADGYWRVGIQKPYAPKGEYVAVLGLQNQSAVTSGIYERYAGNNRQSHHIIDAKTGYPFANEWLSVTVIADESVEAEIYSTVIYAKGKSAGIDFIGKHKHLTGILLDKQHRIFVSHRLMPFFTLKDDAYRVIVM